MNLIRFRPRYTVRWMMAAVAVVGVAVGGLVMARRQSIFRYRARYYAQEEHARVGLVQDFSNRVNDSSKASDGWKSKAIIMIKFNQEHAIYLARLRVKYERLSRYSWLPCEPDPPSPYGFNPEL